MNWRIPLSDLDFGPEEENAVMQVLKSKWLTMGEVTQAFEAEFAAYLGVRHALAVSSCTAALHIACLAAGLKAGDEVILPSLTFVASANAVRYTGATPVFADVVGENDLNISPEAIESCLSPRTRAILVVHYAGYACDMPRILATAKAHGLLVIEDVAHAVGASLEGRLMGNWGDIGCFSFFSNKNMTTGEGGMVVTNDAALADKLRLLRSHGMTSLTWDRHQGRAQGYDVVELGYNYRIDEMRSAIGRVQLGRLEGNNQRRRHLTNLYREGLCGPNSNLTIPFEGYRGISSAHILPLLLPPGLDRDAFMERMKARGIQTSVHFPPIHRFSAYQRDNATTPQPLPVTEDVTARELSLPLYPLLRDEEVAIVVEAVWDTMNEMGANNER